MEVEPVVPKENPELDVPADPLRVPKEEGADADVNVGVAGTGLLSALLLSLSFLFPSSTTTQEVPSSLPFEDCFCKPGSDVCSTSATGSLGRPEVSPTTGVVK